MDFITRFLIIISTISAVMPRQSSDMLWTYWGKKGEKYWDKEFDKCRGRMQSPINILTNQLVVDRNMRLELVNYDIAVENAQMVNTGYKVEIEPEVNDTEILITGSALNNQTYKWVELHFHWADGPHNGSEHAIDGQKFVMECHIVHRNVKYEDTETANIHDDGYAIMALFYVETDQPNQMYDMITEHLHNIQDIGQVYKFETPIYLESLLPPNNDVFYRYSGSYTTPKCNEAVTWIVYPEPVFIDQKQIKLFRQLYTTYFDIRTGHLKRLVGNIRHLHDLGNRIVYTSSSSSVDINLNAILIVIISYIISLKFLNLL